MYGTKEIEDKMKECHNNFYSYDMKTYKKVSLKMDMYCPIHGKFEQAPHTHLKGIGCPQCGIKKRNTSNTLTNEAFIKRAKEIHKDKYDYSKINYINNKTPICIICHEHGEFWQLPNVHLNGSGCPECGKIINSKSKCGNTELFIKQAKEIHGDKYDYSKVKYSGSDIKVTIICHEHGEFQQTPHIHLDGHGCPKCAIKKVTNARRLTLENFIKRSMNIHNNKYDYSLSEYLTTRNKIKIICPIHGVFEQTPDDHLQGKGCTKCGNNISYNENEIYNLISKQGILIQQRNRSIIKPQELDIYIPSKKVAIEYNGLHWHTENMGKTRQYHLSKTDECKKQGVKLIQIFEDEYVNHKEIVENKLLHILGVQQNLPKIFGRKCTIKEIESKQAKEFLNTYHIQGYVGSTTYLGAFCGDKLIAVMTFKKESKNSLKWELNRFASDYHYVCCGVGGKLFKYFIENYHPNEIKSFADRRWTINEENNVYLQLGFKFVSYTKPEYRYYKPQDGCIRQHKFGFRKETLNKKYGLPLTMTETEMTKELGYERIWDCGLIKYVWNNG